MCCCFFFVCSLPWTPSVSLAFLLVILFSSYLSKKVRQQDSIQMQFRSIKNNEGYKKKNWVFLSHHFLLFKLVKMGMIISFLSGWSFPPPKWVVNVNFYFLVYHQCGQRCHTRWLLKVTTLTLWLSFNLSLVFDRKVWRQRLRFLRPLMKQIRKYCDLTLLSDSLCCNSECC